MTRGPCHKRQIAGHSCGTCALLTGRHAISEAVQHALRQVSRGSAMVRAPSSRRRSLPTTTRDMPDSPGQRRPSLPAWHRGSPWHGYRAGPWLNGMSNPSSVFALIATFSFLSATLFIDSSLAAESLATRTRHHAVAVRGTRATHRPGGDKPVIAARGPGGGEVGRAGRVGRLDWGFWDVGYAI